jgi:hypothetical protein
MDKVNAIQQRESERQNLIGSLFWSTCHQREESKDKAFYLKLSLVIIDYLERRQEGILEPEKILNVFPDPVAQAP